jgi:O-antigen ligase
LERAGSTSARRLGLLDWLIGSWIVFGLARMFFDGRVFGLVAVRDFAMVYYAVFFFLAANIFHRQSHRAETLLSLFRNAAVIMGGVYMFTRLWPGVLENSLLLRGVPLIFYKDDLVGVFAAVGAMLQFLRFEQVGRGRHVLFSLALVGVVLFTNNRSALLALVVGAGGLLLAGRWRFITLLGIGGVFGAILMVAVATWQGDTWRDTPLMGVYDRVVSLTDPFGTRQYGGETTSNKGDNNLFRLIWWQEVVGETVEESPVFGLGFGHDLSARFLREYYAHTSEEFSARSPHSIIVTVFGRMGIVGLLLYGAIILQLLTQVVHSARRQDFVSLPPLLAAAMIFASACFGVVLEGPMGAVLFWSLLGSGVGLLAHQADTRDENDDDLPNTIGGEPAK